MPAKSKQPASPLLALGPSPFLQYLQLLALPQRPATMGAAQVKQDGL